jgi:hypothetical protein
MKIIFLDIDGVFNSMNFFKNNQIINKNESSEERIKRNINISKVEMFSNLLKKHPSYEVCLSSSWRIGWIEAMLG